MGVENDRDMILKNLRIKDGKEEEKRGPGKGARENSQESPTSRLREHAANKVLEYDVEAAEEKCAIKEEAAPEHYEFHDHPSR